MSVTVDQLIEDIDVGEIESLVDDYTDLSTYDRDQLNEATVRQQFINPVLRALGWDTTSDQVLPEQRTLAGDADYALSLNGREQFFIEAKRPARDLDDTRRVRGEDQSFAVQAIDYAWHQGCDWAVLTNFETTRLYFSHVPKDKVEDGLVFELSVDDYATDDGLEKLAQLSKPAIRNGSLDALERSRERDTVTDEILNVLSEARVKFTQDVHASHPDLGMDELRDGVQRILDRLVVMRVAEDRSIIPRDTLLKMSESWDETTINRDVRMLSRDLKNAFRDFDSVYNSELFAEHPCEDYELDNDVLMGVLEDLYDYNFAYIDADVLGSIYEDYLGHAIEDKQDGEDLELVAQADERREGGIYYTPVPVVEYIVETTLGDRLDGIMSDVEAELEGDDPDFEAAREEFDRIENIKFLDVTCGSGSFLIKAYDLITECYDEFKELVHNVNGGGQLTSYSGAQTLPNDYQQRILENNLFGVDLDYQATEIASVNLLLKALRKGEKLPTILEDNVKRGNSLLNGSPGEAADVLGISEEEAREMGAFEWEEEFDHVFDETGGFDVIAGNPPWGADIKGIRPWIEHDEYGYDLADGQYDSYELLMELGEDILADDGTLGFIIPDSIFREEHEPLRKWLATQHTVDQAHKLGEGVFEDVWSGTSIVQYTTNESDGSNTVECSVLRKEDRDRMQGTGGAALSTLAGERLNTKPQQRILDEPDYSFRPFANEDDYEIMEIMETGAVDTDEILFDSRGDEIGKSGEVMRCPACMDWDTYPRSRAASKGGGYYAKTCTHCDHEYEFEDAIETREIIKDHQPSDDWKKLYFGEHVTRYRETGRAYIDDSITSIDFEDESLYEPPKILLRKTGFGFNAFIDYDDSRCLQVVFVFRLQDDCEDPFDQYDLEYFLGLLNSRVMLYYYTKERSEIEWQSYPYKTQGLVMNLPYPEVDFDDEEEVEKYDRFVELVRDACQGTGKIDAQEDWEIERLAYEFFGVPEDKRNRITNELKELQRLQVVRELFPGDGDDD
jgi:type I restriction-modification system DNA methylase subunit